MSRPISIVITGEVDHGKSSLVGRILEETNAIPQSRINTVKKICADSGREYEPAFLLDAFAEEQSQGITIDISQINFSTNKRAYRVIDSPGHRDFLKNMVSGSSSADTAIVMVDANEGLRNQTFRHCYILKLLGIENILIVINKMDLQDYSQVVFNKIHLEMQNYLNQIGLTAKNCIPTSAKFGVNIGSVSRKIPWYSGPMLLDALDLLPAQTLGKDESLRMPVQDVYKFDERRIIVGKIESGELNVGDELKIWPSGQAIKVAGIERWNAPVSTVARTGDSIGITLCEQAFVERGNIIGPATPPMSVSNLLEGSILWLGKESICIGQRLKIKLLTEEADCEIASILGIINTSTLQKDETPRNFVATNEVALIVLKISKPIALDLFSSIRPSGRFVLVRNSMVVGGGIISGAFHREADLVQNSDKKKSYYYMIVLLFVPGITFSLVLLITSNALAAALSAGVQALAWQFRNSLLAKVIAEKSPGKTLKKPVLLWFTGLPCSGKSTIANAIAEELEKAGNSVEKLDGDSVRSALPSVGFSREERNRHISSIGFLASRLIANKIYVVASFVSPYMESRDFVRKICPGFIEVYLSTPLEICEQRDTKGMYAKARRNEIAHFTGVSDPYEAPKNPELILDTSKMSIAECVTEILGYLDRIDSNKIH